VVIITVVGYVFARLSGDVTYHKTQVQAYFEGIAC